MALSALSLRNHLNTVFSVPASTYSGPATGDIGADGTTPTPANCMAMFDITLTIGTIGDVLQIAIPTGMQLAGANPSNTGSSTGAGLDITIVPMNAAAVTAAPYMLQGSSTISFTFTATASAAVYRIKMDALHSARR